jgi:recombination protein RecA
MKRPSRNELIKLYVDRRLTTYEIAEIYQVSRKTINRWFYILNIDANPKQRKYELIKKVPLTKEQKEMVVGTLLGDGFVGEHGRKNKSCRLQIGHCEKQKSLVLHKKAILGNLVNSINKKEDKRKNSVMYSFVTVVHNDFRFFRHLFYENNKKVIRQELSNYVTERSLAYWIMDDGTLNNRCNIRLSTDSFSYKEQLILQSMLKSKFNVRSKIAKYNRNQKEYYYISINKRNSQLLSNLVRQYILKDFMYKILPSLND